MGIILAREEHAPPQVVMQPKRGKAKPVRTGRH